MYIGRFAPSPTGALHFGSLLAALASYLDARHQQGRWLVRIEDIDPPREVPAEVHQILPTLADFGLHWDDPVSYQSQHGARYQNTLQQLHQRGLTYRCACSRKDCRQRQALHHYDGYCRRHPPTAEQTCAWRFFNQGPAQDWTDRIQGRIHARQAPLQDCILQRKDRLWSYQLAVVSDDHAQGVTHVVRGYDLLEQTALQQQLYTALGWPTPCYAHIPLALNPQGQKLSKQNLATPLDRTRPRPQLVAALAFLGHPVPPHSQQRSVAELLSWAVDCWDIHRVAPLATQVYQG